MKKNYYFLLILLFAVFYFPNIAKSYDTTFKATLIKSKISNVKLTGDYDNKKKYLTGKFILNVDGVSLSDSFDGPIEDIEIKIIDINISDSFKEILISSTVAVDWHSKIYRFTGDKLIDMGNLWSVNDLIINGDETISGDGWMGFWKCDIEFKLNKEKLKFEIVEKFDYDVIFYEGYDGEIIVNEGFNTYKEKDLNSPVITTFKKGDKLKILKAYTKIIPCNDEYGKDFCFWYLIEDKDGKKGWLQLKDFWQKVDGIPWAG